jgi:hypothetical protein
MQIVARQPASVSAVGKSQYHIHMLWFVYVTTLHLAYGLFRRLGLLAPVHVVSALLLLQLLVLLAAPRAIRGVRISYGEVLVRPLVGGSSTAAAAAATAAGEGGGGGGGGSAACGCSCGCSCSCGIVAAPNDPLVPAAGAGGLREARGGGGGGARGAPGAGRGQRGRGEERVPPTTAAAAATARAARPCCRCCCCRGGRLLLLLAAPHLVAALAEFGHAALALLHVLAVLPEEILAQCEEKSARVV